MNTVLYFFFFVLQRIHKSHDIGTSRGLLFFALDDRYPEQQSNPPNSARSKNLDAVGFACGGAGINCRLLKVDLVIVATLLAVNYAPFVVEQVIVRYCSHKTQCCQPFPNVGLFRTACLPEQFLFAAVQFSCLFR